MNRGDSRHPRIRSRSAHCEGIAAYDVAVRDARPSAYRLFGESYAPSNVTRGGPRDRLELARVQLELAVAEHAMSDALQALGRARLASGDAAGALDAVLGRDPRRADALFDRAFADERL